MSKSATRSLMRLFLVFFTVFLLSVVYIQAQDAPAEATAEPTAIATDTPTDIPTEVVTDVPTDIPTDVPTEVPTEVPTDAPTAEATEISPTETPVVIGTEASPIPSETPIATLVPEPALNLLVSEFFDNGDTSPWTAGAGWLLVPSESGFAWQVSNSNEPLALLKGDFFNVAVQARFLLQDGSAQLVVRQSAAGNYTASIDKNGLVQVSRGGVVLQTAQVEPIISGSSVWRTLRLSVIDRVIRVTVDNVEVIALADDAQLPMGSAAISGNFVIPTDGSAAPANTFLADDFSLWVKANEVQLYPSPTAIPTLTETPAATVEPTEVVTAEPTKEPAATLEPTFVGKDTSAFPQPSADIIALAVTPANDNFSAAEVIPAASPLLPYTKTTDNETLGATIEASEPIPNCSGGFPVSHSVWFNFTPAVTASYTLSTAGSDYDTLIGVYTGSPIASLAKINCNDDASSSTVTSLLKLTLTSGTSYHIQISGLNGRFGTYIFNIKQEGVPVPTTAPLVTGPVDNFRTNNTTVLLPALTWNPVLSNAHHYEVQISTSSTFASLLPQSNANVAGSSLGVPPVLPGTIGTTYYWRVRALNISNQAGPWSTPVRKFVVDTVAPLPPVLTGPAAIVSTAKPAFTWTAAAGATSYLMDLDGTDCTFGDILPPANAVVTGATFTPAASLPQGTYCYRLQSKDAAGNISVGESTARGFSIFIGTAPLNNTIVTTATTGTVIFKWTAVPGASGYNVILMDSNCANPVTNAAGTLLTKTLTGLNPGIYCWTVQAIGVDTTVPTITRTFTVSPAAPSVPVLQTPAKAALITDATPDFTWDASTGAGTPFTYELQADNNGCTFPSAEVDQTGLSATTFTPGSDLPDGIYCWRVRAKNLYSVYSAWSSVSPARAFTLDTDAPAAPTLTAPLANAIISTAKPVFTWAKPLGATSYVLNVTDETCNFTTPIINNQVVTSAAASVTFTPATSLPQGVYCWKVQAKDAAGNAGPETITPRTFSIFIGTAPLNNAVVISATTGAMTFKWAAVPGATAYTLILEDSTCATPIAGYPLVLGNVLTKAVTGLNAGIYCWSVQAIGVDNAAPPTFSKFSVSPAAPAAPSLLLPAIGSASIDTTPTFTWNASASVLGTPYTYDLQADNNGCTFPSPEVNETGLGTTFTPGALVDGTYCWRVRTVNTFNAPGAWSSVTPARNFSIDNAAPAAPNLTAPAVNAIITTAKPTFTWVAAAGANGYLVDIDNTDCTFGSAETTDAPTATASFTPATSLPQGTYCWRVRSKDAAGNIGPEGTPRSFSIFIGTAPVNNFLVTTATTGSVIFKWVAVPGASGYNVIVMDSACANPVATSAGTLLTKTISGLAAGNYCWTIQAGGIDTSIPTITRKFTVSPAAPAAPALLTPTLNAFTNDNTPTFTWNASASTTAQPYTYELMVDNNGCTFPSPTISEIGLGLTFTAGASLADSTYCWRVRTVNKFGIAGGWSSISPARNFTVDTVAPGKPSLVSPADNSSISTLPVFKWTAVAGTKYNILYGTTNPPTTAVNALATTSFTLPGPQLPNTFYWQVEAVDAAGNHSGFTTIRSVKLISMLNAVPLLNRFGASPVILTWGPISWADHYKVYVDNNSNLSTPEYSNITIPAGTQFVNITVPGVLTTGIWYWRVQACDAADVCGAFSTIGTFTIDF